MAIPEANEECHLLKWYKQYLYRELKLVPLDNSRNAEFFVKAEGYDSFMVFYKIRIPQLRRHLGITFGSELNA